MTLVKKAMGLDFTDMFDVKATKIDPSDNMHTEEVKEKLYTLLIYSKKKVEIQSPTEYEDTISQEDVSILPHQAGVKITAKNASYYINLASNRRFEDADHLYSRMFPPSFVQSVLKNLSAFWGIIIS